MFFLVAPLAGAWIEILDSYINDLTYVVAPLAGAWIEIFFPEILKKMALVAPLAGAWIEIMITCQKIECIKSLPSRERGLK